MPSPWLGRSFDGVSLSANVYDHGSLKLEGFKHCLEKACWRRQSSVYDACCHFVQESLLFGWVA